ncbi:MAG: SseB family protein, partial [Bacillus sp. (in: Bacteria)]|nr:SseB family protein [Bacillus sp. (in: firmicutes)]
MTEIERLKEIVETLRGENGCPWDRVQTHESLKPECIEEASEVICGINILSKTGDPENLKEGEVVEGPRGFDIKYIENENGKSVPLFTSDEVMEKAGVRVSTFVVYMSDLAGMLKQTDRYSSVSINPFTKSGLDITMETFLGLFDESSPEEKEMADALNKVLSILKEHSIELDENGTLFLRSDENIMIENAVDGVFVPKMPFYVSSNPEQGK